MRNLSFLKERDNHLAVAYITAPVYVILEIMEHVMSPNAIGLIVCIVIGVMVYLLLTLVYIFLFRKSMKEMLILKINRKY